MVYASSSQPGVHVSLGVHEQVADGTHNMLKKLKILMFWSVFFP
jgi:hypothetical protein